MKPDLNSLYGITHIDGRRVAVMSEERMKSRRTFALAAQKAGFEVEQDVNAESPIKLEFDKGLIGLRVERDDVSIEPGCSIQTIIGLIQVLVLYSSEFRTDAIDRAIYALEMASKYLDEHDERDRACKQVTGQP